MADTSKTVAELKVRFADNVTRDILEQDIRDFVESVFQYGEIEMPATATPTAGQTIGTSYVKVSQFTKDLSSSTYVTTDFANDHIHVVKGGVFAVFIGLSFSGSNNSTWTGSLHIDGVDADEANFARKLSASGDVGKVGSMGILSIADGEIVTYSVKADAAGKTFVLHNGSLILFRLG